jgi:hypothetical protein
MSQEDAPTTSHTVGSQRRNAATQRSREDQIRDELVTAGTCYVLLFEQGNFRKLQPHEFAWRCVSLHPEGPVITMEETAGLSMDDKTKLYFFGDEKGNPVRIQSHDAATAYRAKLVFVGTLVGAIQMEKTLQKRLEGASAMVQAQLMLQRPITTTSGIPPATRYVLARLDQIAKDIADIRRTVDISFN